MKKVLFISLSIFAITVGTIAVAQANSSNDSKAPTPCKKHLSNCPTGYSGGYECKDGLPSLQDCLKTECNQVIECQPDGK